MVINVCAITCGQHLLSCTGTFGGQATERMFDRHNSTQIIKFRIRTDITFCVETEVASRVASPPYPNPRCTPSLSQNISRKKRGFTKSLSGNMTNLFDLETADCEHGTFQQSVTSSCGKVGLGGGRE